MTEVWLCAFLGCLVANAVLSRESDPCVSPEVTFVTVGEPNWEVPDEEPPQPQTRNPRL